MYRTSSLDGKMENISKNNFDFGQFDSDKIFIKFTSPQDTRFYSKNHFSSRLLSKSVPRKNRSLYRYKINRSLNFDVCHKKNDYFLSPSATPKNFSNENLHLSRSAKILKALNIEYSPMKSGYKKINKTLNFDLTPSPKRFPKTNARRTISDLRLSSPSPGINKSLNFDSCDDSPIASIPDTSLESIDENQNQTPLQKSNKVKKSLSRMSLNSSGSSSSFDFNLLSPTLRPGLREKINDIVHASMTPIQKSVRRSYENLMDEHKIAVSTPRNLYDDFSDDEDYRPETPENVVRLVPESMSAIKKSHRKERFSGRFAHRAQIHADQSKKMDVEVDEERPLTPIATEREPSPTYNIHSIKKSHKKDKSKRKIYVDRSDDEQSDTGSLFDYSHEIEDDDSGMTDNHKYSIKNKHNKNDAMDLHNNSGVDLIQNSSFDEPETPPRARIQSPITTPSPSTPENRINYLRKIMTDSIKKSHKKLKDSNKKKLFNSRILEKLSDPENNDLLCHELENVEEGECSKKDKETESSPENKNRANTPDNMNSSRLLLAQFSSVKKSHKKDKHRKIGFAQRHALLTDDNDCSPSKIECEKSSQNLNIPTINITEASDASASSESFYQFDKENSCQSLRNSLLNISDEDFKLISSPKTRKNSLSDKSNISFSSNKSLDLIGYESTEDEFKIFTPIKKQNLFATKTPRTLNECSFSTPLKFSDELSRNCCITPKLGTSILNTQESNVNIESEENDNGRSTPDNQIRIISALSSIKKSHRKDKWMKTKRSRLMEDENNSQNLSNWRSSDVYESSSDSFVRNESSEEFHSPKPSTSYSKDNYSPSPPVKTPPNGLEVKTYLKLIQSTSIKRSHKKMREQRKQNLIADPNLSDDGSIFDEEEKSRSFDTSLGKSKGFDDSHEDFVPLDNYEGEKKSIDSKHSKSNNRSFRSKRSNDGSIFGSDDEEV